MGPRGTERRSKPLAKPSAWLPTLMLDGAPLLDDASIMDFQGKKVDYVAKADAVEQALLLPGNMAELQSMRSHEVFLSFKRYLAMVRPTWLLFLLSLVTLLIFLF